MQRRRARLWVAGSDARTWVPSAGQYLTGLRRGRGTVRGASGDYWQLTRAVLEIRLAMIRERPVIAALCPLLAAVPLVTLGNRFCEIAFARKWVNRLRLGTRHYDNVHYDNSQGMVEFIRA